MHRLIDGDTVKVILAAGAPFIVWGAQLELVLRILAGVGAVIYISIKIARLLDSPTDDE